MDFSGLILSHVRDEFRTLRSAPVAFIALSLLAGFIGWYVRAQWDQREIAVLEGNLRIAEQRVSAAEQRAGVFPDYTEYSRLTNHELKEYALYAVGRLKQFDFEWQKAMAEVGKPENAGNSKFFDEINERFRIEYKTNYASICTNLLEEFFRRIPEEKRPQQTIFGLPLVKTGIMIGHDPIGQVTEYLARLVDTLPD